MDIFQEKLAICGDYCQESNHSFQQGRIKNFEFVLVNHVHTQIYQFPKFFSDGLNVLLEKLTQMNLILRGMAPQTDAKNFGENILGDRICKIYFVYIICGTQTFKKYMRKNILGYGFCQIRTKCCFSQPLLCLPSLFS